MFIETIFKTLSKNDKREFLLFLDRKKRKQNRKDVQVCETIMKGFSPKVENTNSYHAIRNRIKKELITFLNLKQSEKDFSGESDLYNEINLCRYLLQNKLEKEGWTQIKKTEKKAIELKSYNSLFSLYMLILEFSDTIPEEANIETIIEKKNSTKKQIANEEKLIETLAIVRKKLHDFKTNVHQYALHELLENIQQKIDISHPDFYRHPKHVVTYLELIRNSLLYNRDIRQLEPTALKLYTKTKESGGFSDHTTSHRLKMLYILSHALYRNQKLSLCLDYLKEMEDVLNQSKHPSFFHYFAKLTALKSSVYFLKGQLTEAIGIIELFLNNTPRINKEDELNLLLNLLTFYAYNKEYKKANRLFIQMHHSDNWYRKIMGQEWVFKRNSIEMLLQFEMGKDDIALNRINAIIKNNKELTKLPQYKGITNYLNLFKKYISDPTSVNENDLLNISKGSTISQDEEIKKTAFYAWFFAKIKHQDPYRFLLENINKMVE